jgi:hypothetical protein
MAGAHAILRRLGTGRFAVDASDVRNLVLLYLPVKPHRQ